MALVYYCLWYYIYIIIIHSSILTSWKTQRISFLNCITELSSLELHVYSRESKRRSYKMRLSGNWVWSWGSCVKAVITEWVWIVRWTGSRERGLPGCQWSGWRFSSRLHICAWESVGRPYRRTCHWWGWLSYDKDTQLQSWSGWWWWGRSESGSHTLWSSFAGSSCWPGPVHSMVHPETTLCYTPPYYYPLTVSSYSLPTVSHSTHSHTL